MDGLLVIDKPSGPSSHDIVVRARRILAERRIGHTGTLDPMASGVLPLVLGRATRLARFLDGDKTYEATIRLGFSTDTFDALGQQTTGLAAGMPVDRPAVEAALERFRGTFLQQPPVFSAKKIGGERSYAIARRQARTAQGSMVPVTLALPRPVEVTTQAIDVLRIEDDRVTLRVRCSAGFYVRSLANDLGAVLGTGGHLAALRRVEAAGAGLDRAISLALLDSAAGPADALRSLVPMDAMLGGLRAVTLTDDGAAQVRFGRDIGASAAASGFSQALESAAGAEQVRLLTTGGQLLAVAEASETQGFLHPSVVLM